MRTIETFYLDVSCFFEADITGVFLLLKGDDNGFFLTDPGRTGVAALPWIARKATALLKSIGGVPIFSTSSFSFLELK